MMDAATYGDITVCGNFAELQDKKPDNFDYEHTAKWIEPYPMQWRETLGKTVCNCKTVEVHFSPYFGEDYYHRPTCNLMRKLRAEPQIENLFEIHLPIITKWGDVVPDDGGVSVYVRCMPSRTRKIQVRRSVSTTTHQLSLLTKETS